jgi:hypothetical protein
MHLSNFMPFRAGACVILGCLVARTSGERPHPFPLFFFELGPSLYSNSWLLKTSTERHHSIFHDHTTDNVNDLDEWGR